MQTKIAVGAGLALVAWWLSRSSGPGRRTTEIEIDANVYSPTWGEPIANDKPVLSSSPELIALVDESNRRIAAHEAIYGPLPY